MIIIIILCTLVYSVFIIFDLVPLFQQKKWAEFWVYLSIIIVAYVVHFLYVIGIDVPSPAVPLKRLVSYIFGIND